MDENIRLKLQKALKQKKDRIRKPEKTSAKEIKSSRAEKVQTTLTDAKDVLAYQSALEELQKDLDKLESSLTEDLKRKAELEEKLTSEKNTELGTQLKELEKQIAIDERKFKEKQQDFFVLQESIIYFNAGKKYLPTDWDISPHEMTPIHQAFIDKINILCETLPENFNSKFNLLLQSTKYLEAISIASNINLVLSQMISDDVIQDKLDRLYHDYVKVIIIASGKQQTAYDDLVKETCQKLPMRGLSFDDFKDVTYNLFNAYRGLCTKIIGELKLNEEIGDQILSLFITDVFTQKINELQTSDTHEHLEVEATTLYSQLEDLKGILGYIIHTCIEQKNMVRSLQNELSSLGQDSPLQQILNQILIQAEAISVHLKDDANTTPLDEHYILGLLDNINLLFNFPHQLLLLLNEYQTQFQAFNKLCDLNSLNNLHQALQTLITYHMFDNIKHAITEVSQKIANVPSQLSEIKAIEMLASVNLESLQSLILTPLLTQPGLLDEVLAHVTEYNLASSHIKLELDRSKLEQFEKNYPSYQEVLIEISKLKKELLNNPYSLEVLENLYALIKVTASIGGDFKMLSDLKKLLDQTEEEVISPDNQLALKKMHKLLNKDSNLYNLITKSFSFLYLQELHKNIVALKIAQGDLFSNENKEALENILYPLFHEVSPTTMINHIARYYPDYDQAQKKNCLAFIKRFLELDKDHYLVSINFKDNKFIKDLIEFNQFILSEPNQDPDLIQKAQEINELLMTKILEKENQFTERANEIVQGKVHSSLLARNIKNLYQDIVKNSNNIALVTDAVSEVETILQAPNLFASSRQIGEQILNTCKNICQYLSNINIFEDLANRLSDQIHARESKKAPSSEEILPQDEMTEQELDKIISTISHSKVSPAEYNALLDTFVDNIETGYQKRFSEIPYSEFLQYVLDEDNAQIEKGCAPRAKHLRNYKMYDNLIKNYCQIMVFYDNKTQ